ncbi:MAG: hypothetical protein AB1546_04850 [bacterium]
MTNQIMKLYVGAGLALPNLKGDASIAPTSILIKKFAMSGHPTETKKPKNAQYQYSRFKTLLLSLPSISSDPNLLVVMPCFALMLDVMQKFLLISIDIVCLTPYLFSNSLNRGERRIQMG